VTSAATPAEGAHHAPRSRAFGLSGDPRAISTTKTRQSVVGVPCRSVVNALRTFARDGLGSESATRVSVKGADTLTRALKKSTKHDLWGRFIAPRVERR
jgi:hypothetical protein